MIKINKYPRIIIQCISLLEFPIVHYENSDEADDE